jgi:hypothetical protein
LTGSGCSRRLKPVALLEWEWHPPGPLGPSNVASILVNPEASVAPAPELDGCAGATHESFLMSQWMQARAG